VPARSGVADRQGSDGAVELEDQLGAVSGVEGLQEVLPVEPQLKRSGGIGGEGHAAVGAEGQDGDLVPDAVLVTLHRARGRCPNVPSERGDVDGHRVRALAAQESAVVREVVVQAPAGQSSCVGAQDDLVAPDLDRHGSGLPAQHIDRLVNESGSSDHVHCGTRPAADRHGGHGQAIAVGGDDAQPVVVDIDGYPAEHRQVRVLADGVLHGQQCRGEVLAGQGDAGAGVGLGHGVLLRFE